MQKALRLYTTCLSLTAQTTSDGWCAVVGTAAEVNTAGALQRCVRVAAEDSEENVQDSHRMCYIGCPGMGSTGVYGPSA